MKIVIATPTITRPHPRYLEALEASVPALEAEGWEHFTTFEIGSPYISHARSKMLRRALDAKCSMVIFIDHDLSWRPEDLVKLIKTPGWVVAGTYRFKIPPEQVGSESPYMGKLYPSHDGRPIVREDGAVRAQWVPAGFLKVTHEAVDAFMRAYPDLTYGPLWGPHVDLFNHGARGGTWFGEDYSFSQRWNDMGKQLWVVPDLELTHWDGDTPYPGNYHQWLSEQPGGANDQNRVWVLPEVAAGATLKFAGAA